MLNCENFFVTSVSVDDHTFTDRRPHMTSSKFVRSLTPTPPPRTPDRTPFLESRLRRPSGVRPTRWCVETIYLFNLRTYVRTYVTLGGVHPYLFKGIHQTVGAHPKR